MLPPIFYFSLIAITLNIHSCNSALNQPIIGIFSQPADSEFANYGYYPSEYSYIAGEYIHALQAAGARVIPIQWDLPLTNLSYLFYHLNGILFTGGSTGLNDQNGNLSPFGLQGQYLMNLAIQANQLGDYFPVWGTCLGYELMAKTFTNNFSLCVDVAGGINTRKNLLNVALSNNGNSSLFTGLTSDVLSAVQNESLAYFNHYYTPDPQAWKTVPVLKNNFTVTSWVTDSNGMRYAATVEGMNYPFYGAQFHIEKNTYWWIATQNISHGHEAVALQQNFASFFVNFTRGNLHYMDPTVLAVLDIDNDKFNHFPGDQRIYFFPNYNSSSGDGSQSGQSGSSGTMSKVKDQSKLRMSVPLIVLSVMGVLVIYC